MEIKLTKEQIEALQSGEGIIIKAFCKPSKSFPQEYDNYWCIEGRGIHEFTHTSAKSDYQRISIGNSYKTKQDAKQALELAQAKHRLKQAIAEANDGWTPDWGDSYQEKYYIYQDFCNLDISTFASLKFQSNWMYSKDKQTAEQLLKDHKADFELVLVE